MSKMALYQNHVILVQWYNWYKKVQLDLTEGLSSKLYQFSRPRIGHFGLKHRIYPDILNQVPHVQFTSN